MLKVTAQITGGTIALHLEGKLTNPWADELNRYWQEVPGFQRKQVLIDLTGVTFIDSDGKTLLTQMWEEGATFRSAGCLNTSIVEEITEKGRADSLDRKTRTERHHE
jgi:anti-anti-sigma regulatory factor